MGQITDAIFGGASRNAARQQIAGLERAQESVERARMEAQREIEPRFRGATNVRYGGYQGAMDAMANAAPIQADTLQRGNLEAQRQLLRGGRQANTAILGGPIDYSQLYGRNINFDFGSFESPRIAELLGDSNAFRGQGTGFTVGTPLEVGFETTPGDVSTSNPTTNQGDVNGNPNIFVPDAPDNGQWPVDQPPPNQTPGGPFYPEPQPSDIPDPDIPPPKDDLEEPRGGGRQAPINPVKEVYNKPASRSVSLYGGEYELKKGETLADFQKRMEKNGTWINVSMFRDMFNDAGAWR